MVTPQNKGNLLETMEEGAYEDKETVGSELARMGSV